MKKRSFLLVIVALVLACTCKTTFGQDARRLVMSGRNLTAEEVESLEKHLEQNPEDIALRTKLLGHYFRAKYRNLSARESRQKHILWLVVNAPESEVLGIPEGRLDGILERDAYYQAKKAWLDHIQRKPADLKLLEHSANFFELHDRELAIESLQKARALDMDNPQWPKELGHIYSLGVIRKPPKDQRLAAEKALEQFETAYKLSSDSEQNYLLKDLAQMALLAQRIEKAKEYAEKMLSENPPGWNYGNNIHHGNIVLGRIAIKMDDLEEAKKRLVNAGNTPGSPQLNSFGPNMALAKELLEKGEKDVVLKYFELCSKFWKLRKDRLEEWTVAVKDGRMPNFGANLAR
jgi:hypothetical protein